jgi:DNA-binding SARP family transcriptional activator/TolB-like protein/Tfp pilus assembly protein PilF
MFVLSLFGSPRVEGPDGPLSGRIGQRHPLALLALLSLAPGGTLAREKLLALLWPERDDEHARGLLNVAVHTLRRALGEGALQSVGTSLQLDPHALRCDVRDFEEALAAGDTARAVSLYTAPFLDGFFLDSAAFERWVDGERTRLADLYASALEALARRADAEGDATAAVAAWKRRAVHDPCDARVSLALMRALVAAGDRAGALQHAAVHAALLRQELGLEPDPAIVALARDLRSARAAPPAAEAPPRAAGGEAPVPPAPRAAGGPGASGRFSTARGPDRMRAPGRLGARGVAVGVLALALGGVVVLGGGPPRKDPGATPLEASVLVLPFGDGRAAAAADAGDDEYFRDGLTDQIISTLARAPGIRTVARTSAFTFRDRRLDVQAIGREMGVANVLEGSVRRDAGRMRITVNLVRVADRTVIWSAEYDEESDQVFEVQERIARSVVRSLRGELTGVAAEPASFTEDPDALTAYLRGRHAWYRRSPAALLEARERLEEAVRLDPGFGLAHAALADVFNIMGGVEYALLPPADAQRLGLEAARRAVEIDPGLAEAHAAIGAALSVHGARCAEAEGHFRAAIELNPGYAAAHHWYSLCLLALGRVGEARASLRRAQVLDPRSAVITTALARIYYLERLHPLAAAEHRHALELDPGLPSARLGLVMTLVQLDLVDAALAELAEAERIIGGPAPAVLALRGLLEGRAGDRVAAAGRLHALRAASRAGRHIPAEYVAMVHLGLGDAEATAEWVERAVAGGSAWAMTLPVDPVLDPVAAHPRIERMRRAVPGLRH